MSKPSLIIRCAEWNASGSFFFPAILKYFPRIVHCVGVPTEKGSIGNLQAKRDEENNIDWQAQAGHNYVPNEIRIAATFVLLGHSIWESKKSEKTILLHNIPGNRQGCRILTYFAET